MPVRRIDPGGSLFLLLFVVLSLFSATASAASNRSIDDSFGDSVTGQQVTYSPAPAWDNQNCGSHCSLLPDASQAFRNTYTATTFTPPLGPISITMKFTGTAIYVFFILANNNGPVTFTSADFTLDDTLLNSFSHNPDSSNNFEFNQMVFHTENLDNTEHTLVISSSGPSDSWVNFDYALYTFEDDITTPQPPQSSGGNEPTPIPKTTIPGSTISSNPTVSNDDGLSATSPTLTPVNSVNPVNSISQTATTDPTPSSATSAPSNATSTSAISSATAATSVSAVITPLENVSTMLPHHTVTSTTSTFTASPSNLGQPGPKSKTRVSVGAVVGGLFAALVIVTALIFCIVRRGRRSTDSAKPTEEESSFPEPTAMTEMKPEKDEPIGTIYPYLPEAAAPTTPPESSEKLRLPFLALPPRPSGSWGFLSASGTTINSSGLGRSSSSARRTWGTDETCPKFEEVRKQRNGSTRQTAYSGSERTESIMDPPPPPY